MRICVAEEADSFNHLFSFDSLQESQLPLPSSSFLVCLVFHVNLLPCPPLSSPLSNPLSLFLSHFTKRSQVFSFISLHHFVATSHFLYALLVSTSQFTLAKSYFSLFSDHLVTLEASNHFRSNVDNVENRLQYSLCNEQKFPFLSIDHHCLFLC